MPTLAVKVVRFVDEHQPGFVECVSVDARGEVHSFIEKVPIVSADELWSTSTYPQPGAIDCHVESRWEADGKGMVQVNTELPWGVESTAGQTRFIVLAGQVSEEPTA